MDFPRRRGGSWVCFLTPATWIIVTLVMVIMHLSMTDARANAKSQITWYATDQYMVDLAAHFNDLQDEIAVHVIQTEPGMNHSDTLLQGLAAGQFDVVTVTTGSLLARLVDGGLLLSLDDFLSRGQLDIGDDRTLIDLVQINGRLYGIPLITQHGLTYADTERFRSTGIDLPHDGWTWSEFHETALNLSNPMHDYYGVEVDSTMWLFPYAQLGGDLSERDMSTLQKAFEITDPIIKDPKANVPPHRSGAYIGGTHFFPQRSAAMTISVTPTWDVLISPTPIRTIPEGGWTTLPLPAISTGQSPSVILINTYIALPRDSQDPESVLKFISWLTSATAAQLLARTTHLPQVPAFHRDSVLSILIEYYGEGIERVLRGPFQIQQPSRFHPQSYQLLGMTMEIANRYLNARNTRSLDEVIHEIDAVISNLLGQ